MIIELFKLNYKTRHYQKDYLTPNEFALINQKNDYVKMIDMVTSDYVLKSKHLRMQLALNGYDFSKNSLEIVRVFLNILSCLGKHLIRKINDLEWNNFIRVCKLP